MFHALLSSARRVCSTFRIRQARLLRRAAAAVRIEALENRQMLAAGDFETTFNGTGYVLQDLPSANAVVTDVAIQSDNKIVVVGYTIPSNNDNDFFIARFNLDGTIDTTFGAGNSGIATTNITAGASNSQDFAYTVCIQQDQKVLVGGSSSGDGVVVRYNTDGSLDTAFGSNGIVDYTGYYFNQIRTIVPYTSGRYLLGGGTAGELDVAVMNSDGTLDTSFAGGSAGETRTDAGGDQEGVRGLAYQPADGKIIAAGTGTQPVAGGGDVFTVMRYNTDGTLDSTFGDAGMVQSPFNSDGDDDVTSMVLQPNGKILVGGSTSTGSIKWHFALARYNADGTLDTTFNGSGRAEAQFSVDNQTATSETYDIALQADGKIVACGYSEVGPSGDNWFSLARYNADGTMDTDFGQSGEVSFPLTVGQTGYAQAVALQSSAGNDWIVMAGNTGNTGNRSGQLALARLWAEDVVPPTAVVHALPAVPGSTTYSFQVVYTDDVNMAVATINAANVQVTKPGGAVVNATLAGLDANADGPTRTATYTIPAPGGFLDLADNGTYTVAVFGASITDTSSNPVSANLGTFNPNVVVGTINKGVLKVYGSAGNDTIAVTNVKGKIRVSFNKAVQTFSNVKSVYVYGLAGNDNISMGKGVPACRIDGGIGNDVIRVSNGYGTILGGAGNDTIYARNGIKDTIDGGTGTNSAQLDIIDRRTHIQRLLK